MWTYLPQWFVQDGQVDELAPGSSLPAAAVAAHCRQVTIVDGSRSPGVVRAEPGAGGYCYDVTGLAGAVHDVLVDRGDGRPVRVGSEFLLTSGSLQVLARTVDFFVDEVAGSMVTARCALWVLADYETGAFDLPDVRQDRSVEAVQIERRLVNRRMVQGPSDRLDTEGYAGDVVELIDVPRIRRWADDPKVAPGATAAETVMNYVLDLRLLRPAIQQP